MSAVLHPKIVLAALQSRAHLEAKRETQDGLIWPFARREMRSARRIRERIAEDAARLVRSGETCITTGDFLRIGWLRGQLETHGREALAALGPLEAAIDPFSPEAA
jgi:hypothetical protein